jgi:hypothetical protein
MKRCALWLTLFMVSCGDGYDGDKTGPVVVSNSQPPLQDPTCEQYPSAITSDLKACASDDECPVPYSPCSTVVCKDGSCIEQYEAEGTAGLCSDGRVCRASGACCTDD